MAGIKSGTAYVDVVLGAVSGLRKSMHDAVVGADTGAGAKAGKKIGDELSAGSTGWLAGFRSSISSAFGGVASAVATARKHIKTLSDELGRLAYQFQFAGAMATIAFTAPVAGLAALGAAIGVKFAVQVEDAMVALKALLPAGYNVEALIKRLQRLAIASPVFDSASVITFTQRMVSAGVEVSKTERFL